MFRPAVVLSVTVGMVVWPIRRRFPNYGVVRRIRCACGGYVNAVCIMAKQELSGSRGYATDIGNIVPAFSSVSPRGGDVVPPELTDRKRATLHNGC